MELLAGTGAAVEFSDPLIGAVTLAGAEHKSVALTTADPADYDLVAVLVARRGLDLGRFIAARVPIFDAAHALAPSAAGAVEQL
jgi:hypothetical protein